MLYAFNVFFGYGKSFGSSPVTLRVATGAQRGPAYSELCTRHGLGVVPGRGSANVALRLPRGRFLLGRFHGDH